MIRLQQEPLSNHTTFRIGGPALHYLIPETMEEVSEALDFARSNHYPFYVIGKQHLVSCIPGMRLGRLKGKELCSAGGGSKG